LRVLLTRYGCPLCSEAIRAILLFNQSLSPNEVERRIRIAREDDQDFLWIRQRAKERGADPPYLYWEYRDADGELDVLEIEGVYDWVSYLEMLRTLDKLGEEITKGAK